MFDPMKPAPPVTNNIDAVITVLRFIAEPPLFAPVSVSAQHWTPLART